MRRTIAGILLVGTILSLPVGSEAHERQCPSPITLTEQDRQELLEVAFRESGNQGVEGQMYVMSVVLNRVASPDYPDDIYSVIHQKSQFTTKGKAQVTDETKAALAAIEAGCIFPDIIGFERAESAALNEFFEPAFVHKDHMFYTTK